MFTTSRTPATVDLRKLLEEGEKETVKVEVGSKVLSKVDALLLQYKEISPVKKVPDDIAEIERRLLAIVGPPEQIDKDFEELVDDEEMLEEDVEPGEDAASRIDSIIEVENVHKDSDNNIRDIKKVQAELIKMQEISDDEEEEEEDRMQDFEDEDNLEDVLNFKEGEEDGGLNDESDTEDCIEDDDENDIDREINMMGEDDVVDISELDELVS